MKELMSELGLSIVYLSMTAGFIALMVWFIDQLNAGGA
jgi:hypothetical protein